MMTNELNKEYQKMLALFCESFENSAKMFDPKTGFIFLFIREDHPEAIDMASNLKTGYIIKQLKAMVKELEKKQSAKSETEN